MITVGAIEQLRNITNEVFKCDDTGCTTNKPWQTMTDASDEVAAFSSRGNVGVGVEGDNGRFKPDVVAPGTFVISTRSTQWDTNTYYQARDHERSTLSGLIVSTNVLWVDAVLVPDNAVQFTIQVLPNASSPVPFPPLPIYVRSGQQPTTADFVGNNQVSLPPDRPLTAGVLFYGIGNNSGKPVSFDLVTDLVTTNAQGNYSEVLRKLNDDLGQTNGIFPYRFETGTSMAVGGVSGTLALIQQFFEQRMGRTNSPALMKALLINGARSAGNLYDFQVDSAITFQGWGLIDLTNSIPGSLTNAPSADVGPSPMLYYDQSSTEALATGQSATRNVSLDPAAQGLPLRVTLVWTDPPGNPIASIKLVNDLDLVVTNLDNGNVFFGNSFAPRNDFSSPADFTNAPPSSDVVNNVENVYIAPPLGTNYSVTVLGRHVNVNAVSAQTNNVSQDYALVISSGNGEVTNALKISSSAVVSADRLYLTPITNIFSSSPGYSGGILTHQHVGANPELVGTNTVPLDASGGGGLITMGITNQWHFYILTNDTTFTNAAFLTYLPPNLAVPRMGVYEDTLEDATRPEADIDLYVSTNSALTNLDPTILQSAYRSLSSGGTETVTITNARPGAFYLGVKSEDQQSAEYSILGILSETPFSENQNGNLLLHGFPVPQFIPDGSPQRAGQVTVFAIATEPIKIRRVIVTNILTHELMGDLLGSLSHNKNVSVLNNHTTNMAVFNQTFIYDDSDEHNVPGARHSDGPGSLQDYAGGLGLGQWRFTETDNSQGHTGTNVGFGIFIERQPDPTQGITADIEPGACRMDYIDVPGNATNLTFSVSLLSGTGPSRWSCVRWGRRYKLRQHADHERHWGIAHN